MEASSLSLFSCYAIIVDTKYSSVVGMVFMLLTFPIPGKFAQLVNKVQIERMKKVRCKCDLLYSKLTFTTRRTKTDARVQSITESEFCTWDQHTSRHADHAVKR